MIKHLKTGDLIQCDGVVMAVEKSNPEERTALCSWWHGDFFLCATFPYSHLQSWFPVVILMVPQSWLYGIPLPGSTGMLPI